ncbi:MAG: pyridoxal 5'-phosphate synthase glutaminase subunit PdxT [Prevotella sp.]|jgi:5'-phosphate synthase pdxT subunit|nr:pyridoxal 5'-phosphate synthase glutaminase subunit PdxT [Prevotella sp.]
MTTKNQPRIAVLALQGAFAEHISMLRSLGVETFEVRCLDDWRIDKDALVIPGGESTVMGRIMLDEGLLEPIRNSIAQGLPVMGTCAGCILLASDVVEAASPSSAQTIDNEKGLRQLSSRRPNIGTIDMKVVRNAYGRQLGSFTAVASVDGIGDDVPMTFIRAPYIMDVGKDVDVLAKVDGKIVAARQGKQLALTFHPELPFCSSEGNAHKMTFDKRIHEYFLSMI